MNIKTIAVLLLIATSLGSLQAQRREVKEEQLEAQRVSFITTQLDLSQEEAKVFWPVYEDYQKERKEIKEKRKTLEAEVENIETVTNDEAGDMIAKVLALEEQEIELKRRYVGKLEPTIGNKKIAMLFSLEREFRERVLRSLKRKMRDRRER